MNNILNIVYYTIREAMARKIIIIFAVISTITLIGFALFFSMFNVSDFVKQSQAAGLDPGTLIERFVTQLKAAVIIPLYGGCLFISIFSMTGIISSMLEKGNIDLFLSKPISRVQLLMGKYLGGLVVVFLNIAYIIIGLWIIFGLKFSIWNPDFLYSILSITFSFGVIYALIILLSILTRTSVLPLIISYLIFFVFSPLLAGREKIYSLSDTLVTKIIMEGLYYITPQLTELGGMSVNLASAGTIGNNTVLFVSILHMVLIMAAGITVFNKKDY